MIIIYVHGLDSSANSTKGTLLHQYCEQNHPDIKVVRPDLNESPHKVFESLCNHVKRVQAQNEQVVLIGSSLGGYFSTLVGNEMRCPAILLNPSTQPHLTLKRFVNNGFKNTGDTHRHSDVVIYKTAGGWNLTLNDLDWFTNHKLSHIKYPKKMMAIIKMGDELLNPNIAASFYSKHGVAVDLQEGGNHRMTDFEMQLPKVMDYVYALCR